jgi:AcrR family transcriptional regulator
MASGKIARTPPLGLRERKKADTHKRILRTASRLFDRLGYPATSMEAIAAAADLSATTLYNYFGTKGQILLAMIARSDEELMEAEKATTVDAGRSGADHIAGFLSRLTRHSLERIDKGTWRYAIAHTLISENTEDIKEGYGRINARLLSYIVSILEDLRDNDVLPVSDLRALGEMIFDMYRALFIRFISTETLSEQDHDAAMHRYVSAAIGAETRKVKV